MDTRPRLAVDIGCGPGHTTLLLAECTQSRTTVGLDNSERFLHLAEAQARQGICFKRHDATRVPFPVGPADALYCRLFLSHVTDPTALLAAWASALADGGLLLCEEVESIATDDPVFRHYLRIVDALLASRGQRLYVGPQLHSAGAPATLGRLRSEVGEAVVPSKDAATMFWMNVQSWRHQPFVLKTYRVEEIDTLEQELRARVVGARESEVVVWGLRHCVYRRA